MGSKDSYIGELRDSPERQLYSRQKDSTLLEQIRTLQERLLQEDKACNIPDAVEHPE